jgi:succinate dehydrogenase hydrophobic anchor subunit
MLTREITGIKLVSLLIGHNLIVLTLTDGKVLEWFKSLERGNF